MNGVYAASAYPAGRLWDQIDRRRTGGCRCAPCRGDRSHVADRGHRSLGAQLGAESRPSRGAGCKRCTGGAAGDGLRSLQSCERDRAPGIQRGGMRIGHFLCRCGLCRACPTGSTPPDPGTAQEFRPVGRRVGKGAQRPSSHGLLAANNQAQQKQAHAQ